jgi:hypothetical protein
MFFDVSMTLKQNCKAAFSWLTLLNRCFKYIGARNASPGIKGRMRIEMIPSEQKDGLS